MVCWAVRTGTWHVKLAGKAGHMQVHVLRQLPVQLGTWHSNLAGNTDICRSTWSAGHQYRDLARQTGKECWTCLGPRGLLGHQDRDLAHQTGMQGALDACRSTWCAGRQDRDLARQTGRECWTRAGSLGVPVVRWHGKLAGSTGCVQVQPAGHSACRTMWSAGHQDSSWTTWNDMQIQVNLRVLSYVRYQQCSGQARDIFP